MHQGPLRGGPALAFGERADGKPFPECGKLFVLTQGIPARRTFREPELRAPLASFPLLAGQPVPQGGNKVIVGQLVKARGGW